MDEPTGSSSECADEEDDRSDWSASSSGDISRKSRNRRKRGKYRKYSIELKREIGRYAQTHGKQNAIEHFSGTLGFTLSESTVRHFVRQCGHPSPPPPGLVRRKARLAYSREFRAQVGEFASEFGNSKARDHFETSLGVRVPESTIRDMKKWFLSRNERQSSGDSETDSKKVAPKGVKRQRGRKNFKYELEQRLVIADYAFKNGNTSAVRFFARYGLELNESTVRSFKRKFLRLETSEMHPESETLQAVKAGQFNEKLDQLFSEHKQSAEIPSPEVTIQWRDSNPTKKGSETLVLPVPDVTIERLPAVVSRGVGTDELKPESTNGGSPVDEGEEERVRRKRQEDLEAQEAALRLLDLARGIGLVKRPAFEIQLVENGHEEGDSFEETTIREENSPNTQNHQDHQEDPQTSNQGNEFVERFRKKYTQDLKHEIGRYALIHGVSSARRVYSERMGRVLPRTSVRDMMVKYQARHGLMNLPALNPVNVSS